MSGIAPCFMPTRAMSSRRKLFVPDETLGALDIITTKNVFDRMLSPAGLCRTHEIASSLTCSDSWSYPAAGTSIRRDQVWILGASFLRWGRRVTKDHSFISKYRIATWEGIDAKDKLLNGFKQDSSMMIPRFNACVVLTDILAYDFVWRNLL